MAYANGTRVTDGLNLGTIIRESLNGFGYLVKWDGERSTSCVGGSRVTSITELDMSVFWNQVKNKVIPIEDTEGNDLYDRFNDIKSHSFINKGYIRSKEFTIIRFQCCCGAYIDMFNDKKTSKFLKAVYNSKKNPDQCTYVLAKSIIT